MIEKIIKSKDGYVKIIKVGQIVIGSWIGSNEITKKDLPKIVSR